MSTQTEPVSRLNTYHLTDARARCIAYRVVGEVLEQLQAVGGDVEAILVRLAAGQEAADQAWERALAAWRQQVEEDARDHEAWTASIDGLSTGDLHAAWERRRREQSASWRFAWPPLDPAG